MTPIARLKLALAGVALGVVASLLVSTTGAAQAVARSFFLIDSAQNALASAIAAPGGADRGLVVREAGTPTITLPNEGQQTAANSISVTPDTDNDAIGSLAAAPPPDAIYIGGLTSGATGGFLAGVTVCDSFVNINVVTATTTLLVTGVAARHVRICALNMLSAGVNNVALVSGTGATCATGTTGMTGGTTAATGYNFAANTGISQGTGFGEVNRTNATGDSVCIITSAAVQLSGRLAYSIY